MEVDKVFSVKHLNWEIPTEIMVDHNGHPYMNGGHGGGMDMVTRAVLLAFLDEQVGEVAEHLEGLKGCREFVAEKCWRVG